MEPTTSPPRPGWQWLILLTPAVVNLSVLAILKYRDSTDDLGPFLLNLLAFPALCLGFGLWWEWGEPTIARRIGYGIVAGLAIILVNGLLAFAGCAKLNMIVPPPMPN